MFAGLLRSSTFTFSNNTKKIPAAFILIAAGNLSNVFYKIFREIFWGSSCEIAGMSTLKRFIRPVAEKLFLGLKRSAVIFFL